MFKSFPDNPHLHQGFLKPNCALEICKLCKNYLLATIIIILHLPDDNHCAHLNLLITLWNIICIFYASIGWFLNVP